MTLLSQLKFSQFGPKSGHVIGKLRAKFIRV